MREIKFRAWMEEDKKMFYFPWYFGSAHGNTKGNPEKMDRPIMQYTGLKDKNGKEIYEGDIVKAKHTTVPVWWSDELARWEMSNPKDFEDYIVHNGEDYEVIGNAYENPELLNKGSE